MLYYTLGHSNKILASSKEQAKFAKKYIKDASKIIKIFYIGDDVPEINFEERFKEFSIPNIFNNFTSSKKDA